MNCRHHPVKQAKKVSPRPKHQTKYKIQDREKRRVVLEPGVHFFVYFPPKRKGTNKKKNKENINDSSLGMIAMPPNKMSVIVIDSRLDYIPAFSPQSGTSSNKNAASAPLLTTLSRCTKDQRTRFQHALYADLMLFSCHTTYELNGNSNTIHPGDRVYPMGPVKLLASLFA